MQLTLPSGQRDGLDRGRQPFHGALLACGYQPRSRGYTGQPELVSSWKILPLKQAKTCCCNGIIALCETTKLFLTRGGKQRQQQGALKPLRFHSQDAMASSSQPCLFLWKSVPIPSGGWCLQIGLGLLWLHKSQETPKVYTFHTTKKGQEEIFRGNILSESPQVILKRVRKSPNNEC